VLGRGSELSLRGPVPKDFIREASAFPGELSFASTALRESASPAWSQARQDGHNAAPFQQVRRSVASRPEHPPSGSVEALVSLPETSARARFWSRCCSSALRGSGWRPRRSEARSLPHQAAWRPGEQREVFTVSLSVGCGPEVVHLADTALMPMFSPGQSQHWKRACSEHFLEVQRSCRRPFSVVVAPPRQMQSHPRLRLLAARRRRELSHLALVRPAW
jgi:hypothetical protein